MSTSKDKIGFIAAARCIGILLVVFGHSFPFNVHIPPVLSRVNTFIYVFHMPLFIFLSGYLLTRNTRPAWGYIRRRGVRLLLPYFVLSVAAFVPKAMFQRFLNDSVELSLQHLVKTELIPRENVWGHFWYIPVVFFLCCFGVLALRYMRKHRTAGLAVLAAAYALLFVPQTTDWFALEDMRKTAFYFVLGMVVADWNQHTHVLSNQCWLLALPGAVTLFASVRTTLTDSMVACLMIGFILCIGTRLPLAEKGLLGTIEKYSFSIFLLSWPAQAVMEVVCNKVLHLPAVMTMGIMFLAGICVPLVCVKIVSLIEKRIPMRWVKLIIGM